MYSIFNSKIPQFKMTEMRKADLLTNLEVIMLKFANTNQVDDILNKIK